MPLLSQSLRQKLGLMASVEIDKKKGRIFPSQEMSQTSNASEAQRSWEIQMHQQRPPTRLLARSSWVALVQKNIVKNIAGGNPGLPGTLFAKVDRM